MKTYSMAEIISNEKTNAAVYKMVLKSPDIAANSAMGQFINIYLDRGELILPRPISICYADKVNGELTIYYHVAGKGTEYMSRFSAGKLINIAGPLGSGFDYNDYRSIALIGGGIGVPPLYSCAVEIKEKFANVDIKAFLGFRSKENIILEKEFKSLGIETLTTTDDGSNGLKGNALEAFTKSGFIPDSIFSCGPYIMLKHIASYAQQNNILLQVSMEERMACGIGACFGCAIPIKNTSEEGFEYKKVCKDGPVFHGKEVVWK